MAAVAAGPLLRIQPSDLQFSFELGVDISVTVNLENLSNDPVGFKVKTNAPRRYFTQPPTGVLPPKGSCIVTVTMLPQTESLIGLEIRDKFLVQSTVVPKGLSEAELPSNLKEINSEVFEVRLPAKIVEGGSHTKLNGVKPLEDAAALQEVGGSEMKQSELKDSKERSQQGLGIELTEGSAVAELPAVGTYELLLAKVKAELAAAIEAKEESERQCVNMRHDLEAAAVELERLREEREDGEKQGEAPQAAWAAEPFPEQEELERLRVQKEEDAAKVQVLLTALAEAEELAIQRVQEMKTMRAETEQDAQKRASAVAMSLRSELASTRAQNSQLLTQLEMVDLQREEAQRSLRELQAKLTALERAEETEASLSDDVDDSSSKLAQTTAAVAALQEQLNMAEASRADLETERDQVRAECSNAVADLAAARERIRSLEESLAALNIYSSTTMNKEEEFTAQEVRRTEQLRRELAIVRVETQEAREAIDELKMAAEKFLDEKLALEEVISQVEITDVRHDTRHTLRLIPTAPSGFFTCSACFKYGKDWLWECSNPSCSYCLHLDCAVINRGADPRS